MVFYMGKLVFILIALVLAAAAALLYIEGPAENAERVKLYYYNPALDMDEEGNILCSKRGLVAVERTMQDATPESALELLLRGEITEAEKASGITSEFPLSGVSLLGAELASGVLTLTFEDPEFKTSGGACRAGILWFQIEETAKQFPGVEEVRFMPEELFQP